MVLGNNNTPTYDRLIAMSAKRHNTRKYFDIRRITDTQQSVSLTREISPPYPPLVV